MPEITEPEIPDRDEWEEHFGVTLPSSEGNFKFIETLQSDPAIKWKTLERDSKPELFRHVSIILDAFSLPEITTLSQSASAEVASNNFKVRVQGGQTFLVKRCIQFGSESHIAALAELFDYLSSEGLNVPHFVKTSSGGLRYIHEGAAWVVFDFIDADHFLDGSKAEISAAAKEMGRLDRTLAAFQSERPDSPAVRYFNANQGFSNTLKDFSVDDFQKLLEIAREAPEDDPYRTTVLETAQSITEAFGIKDQLFAAAEYDHRLQLIHNDLHTHNIPVGKRGEVYFVDFDLVINDSVYYDIGYALYCSVRSGAFRFQNLTGMTHSVDGHVAELKEAFLSSYHSGYPEIDLESPLLTAYALHEALRSVVFYLDRHYRQGNTQWGFHLPKLLNAPREILRIF